MTTELPIQTETARSKILGIAAQEIFVHGFQSASISEILRKAEVSKGCFYHHFPTKQSLGIAVLEESYIDKVKQIWEPIFSSENPLAALIHLFQYGFKSVDCEKIKLGCPINNLAQEMSPIDNRFRQRLEFIYQVWKQRLTKTLKKAQDKGYMRNDVDPKAIATLTIATTQGAIGIAKNSQQAGSFTEYTQGLVDYLISLQT